MTWFTLPKTQADNSAAFSDSDSAVRWLAGQPQANAPAMLAELVKQIQALNGFDMAPRERFKTLEVLRSTLFAVSGEGQRRYEYKPLPLLPAEQAALASALKLWRAAAVAYLHCLRACLEGDASIVADSARVAHRILACLRMEQLNGYLAGAEPAGEFWRHLHAVLASAEQLGVTLEPVEDRLLGETSESTVSGQYAMVLLLHLACPSSLTRGQFAAASQWLARWRELAKLRTKPDLRSKSCCVALDLSQDRPLHDLPQTPRAGRWLSLNGVLRKMQQRLELLAAGEFPESLKLGSGLSSDACVALLNSLIDRLKFPLQPVAEVPAEAASVLVAIGLETIHRVLGGKGLKDDPVASSAQGSKLNADQIAIFGHVVREAEVVVEKGNTDSKAENWRIRQLEPGLLHLLRPAGRSETRLSLRGLLAIKLTQNEHYTLATISRLHTRGLDGDGELCIAASLFFGEPEPLIAEMREKPTSRVSRHPAFLLPAENDGLPSSVLLPAGLTGRALSIRFIEAREQHPLDLHLDALIERGSDCERWSWSCASA
jgi:hypothetical protein